MAKETLIFSFRDSKELADELDHAYGNFALAAQRITRALPFLRNRTFDELRGQFTPAEAHYLVDMMKLIDFDPRFTTNKAAMLQEVKDIGTHGGLADKWKVNVQQFIIRLDQLSTTQLYFLLDFCKAFWERGEIQEGDLEEYLKVITK